ncbi:hypothetical protein [Rhizosphaericola mali]|uniref:Uncharacterized protein n=1 Tax=Rhizosphaericola mali TaxID=2545455 RepID=A0A5P2G3J3_9BACT|nr:hypothetical protein [Rhizosphaericola mali]QES88380.1 hypothetical protein E0W69_006810 [Rhizosphaericola mali]
MKKQVLSASLVALLVGSMLTFDSCSKKDSDVSTAVPENEPMTTVKLQAVNEANTTDTINASWTLNPDTNIADTANYTLNLKANNKYAVKIYLIDSTQTPPEDITDEIWERRNYHLFFLQPTPMASGFTTGVNSPYIPETYWDNSYETNTAPYLNLSIVRTDHDDNNPELPVGISSEFTTGTSSNGYLRVVLRHQPNVKDGTWLGSQTGGGSTDIDSKFKVTIQ